MNVEGAGSDACPGLPVTEMPDCQPERQNTEAVCQPRIMAVMNLPATPEGKSGGYDHENSPKRIQGDSFHWLNKSS